MSERRVKMCGRLYLEGYVPGTPTENLERAHALQMEYEKSCPYPKPRGFVFKAKTWEDYETWCNSQENPRLWSW